MMKMTGWQRFWLFVMVLLFVYIATGVVVSLNLENGDVYEATSSEESSGASAQFEFAVMWILLMFPFLTLIAFVPRARFAERVGSAGTVRSIAVGLLHLLVQTWIAWMCTFFLFYWFVHDHYLISISYLLALLVFATIFWIDVKRLLPNSAKLWFAVYMIVLVVFSAHFGLHGQRLKGLQMTHEEIARRGLVGAFGGANSIVVAMDGAIYAGSCRDVYRSTDKGASWTYISKGLKKEKDECLEALAINDDAIYAGTHQFIFKSTDKGAHWTRLSQELSKDNFTKALAVAPDGTLYAVAKNGIFKSVDKGVHWVAAGNTELFFNGALAVAPDGAIYADTREGIFKSVDQGAHWAEIKTRANIIAAAPDGTIYAAKGLQVIKSTDKGIHWTDGIQWFFSSQFRSLAVAPDGTIYVATTQGFCKSADSGASWRPLGAVDTSELQCK